MTGGDNKQVAFSVRAALLSAAVPSHTKHSGSMHLSPEASGFVLSHGRAHWPARCCSAPATPPPRPSAVRSLDRKEGISSRSISLDIRRFFQTTVSTRQPTSSKAVDKYLSELSTVYVLHNREMKMLDLTYVQRLDALLVNADYKS